MSAHTLHPQTHTMEEEEETGGIAEEDEYDHVSEHIFYTPICIPGKDCDSNAFESQILTRCDCVATCDGDCVCVRVNGTRPYDGGGKLQEEKFHNAHVTECNSRCGCVRECRNRIVQRGPRANLEIKRFDDKGYGVSCTQRITKGEFVCEYAGEIIGREEALRRQRAASGDMNYIFWLNEYAEGKLTQTVIDATCIANIGRYVNHSCDPNCVVVPVRVDSVVPRLAIFAARDIEPDVEITYSYSGMGDVGGEEDGGKERKMCLCGAANCQKYLPFQF